MLKCLSPSPFIPASAPAPFVRPSPDKTHACPPPLRRCMCGCGAHGAWGLQAAAHTGQVGWSCSVTCTGLHLVCAKRMHAHKIDRFPQPHFLLAKAYVVAHLHVSVGVSLQLCAVPPTTSLLSACSGCGGLCTSNKGAGELFKHLGTDM